MSLSASNSTPLAWDRSLGYERSKRLFDILFAAVGLLLLAPLGVIVAIVIKATDGGTIFYRQKRVGRHGVPFEILKFRSMRANADKMGPSVTKGSDPRITSIGKILRRLKIDELPQLWNVLVGEMSFVGPRPEVPRYVAMYTETQREVLNFRPGITDIASIRFRSEEALLASARDVDAFYVKTCMPKKIELNLRYAASANLGKDLLVIAETLCPYWLAVVVAYAGVLALSLWLAYELRFDFDVPQEGTGKMGWVAAGFVLTQLVVLLRAREFSGLLSYLGWREVKRLGRGLGLAAGLGVLVSMASAGKWAPPRGVVVIDGMLAFGLLAAGRAWLRTLRERRGAGTATAGTENEGAQVRERARLGIIGTGPMGAWLASEIGRGENSRWKLEVLFDDDPKKWHKQIHGVEVVGMPELLLDGSWTEKLDEVIVADLDCSPARLEEIRGIVARSGVVLSEVPSLREVLAARSEAERSEADEVVEMVESFS